MKSHDKIEPIEDAAVALSRSLHEWEDIATQILDLLDEQAGSGWSANWHPHLDQMRAVVARFRDGCRAESESANSWLSDEERAAEVHDRMWAEGDRLAKWLHRMTS
jgi:hypothetical protein